MEREILFRGKTPGGKWVEGIYSPYNWNIDLERENKPQIIIFSENKGIDGLWCDIIPETVGQYTGLIAKNGKKIYEGDIVKAFDCIYIVMWDSVRAMFYLRDHISRVTSDFYNYFGSNLVVISNIHDNPEMLNAAAKDIANDADAGGLAPATAENFELMRG